MLRQPVLINVCLIFFSDSCLLDDDNDLNLSLLAAQMEKDELENSTQALQYDTQAEENTVNGGQPNNRTGEFQSVILMFAKCSSIMLM